MADSDGPTDYQGLIERDVDPLTFPDRIYAIGGAGKSVVFELLQQDWFLVEAMRGQEQDGTINVVILDTAGGERDSDRKQLDAIREQITAIEGEMQDRFGSGFRDVDIQREYITDHINIASSADFTSDSVKQQVYDTTDADYWWVDHDNLFDAEANMLDFSKGVIRRRALSKAFYYKARSNSRDLGGTLRLTAQDEEVAVVTGLGGGTGSGLCLDVARHLQEADERLKVTLFGVLPTHLENDKKKANAYAALSELEYSALEADDEVYDDIVLLPSNPTGYSGDSGSGFQQFDTSFAYTLVSFYDMNQDIRSKGRSAYAPFTMAVPQVLRYDVEAIKQAKEFASGLLDRKDRAQQLEEELYEEILNFLESNYGTREDADLTESEIEIIHDRIDAFERLVEFPLFEQLEYLSVEHGQEALRNIYEDDADGLDALMANVTFAIRNAFSRTGRNETSRDAMDERLDDILGRELELVEQLHRVLKYRKQVDEAPINRMLGFFLNPDKDAAEGQSVSTTITGRQTEASKEVSRLTEELEELEEEIATRRAESESRVNDKLAAWKRAVRDDAETLTRVAEIDIELELQQLEDDLRTHARHIENADSKQEVDNVQDTVLSALRDIEDRLQGVAVDADQLREDIRESIDLLARAKKQWLAMNASSGLLGSLLGGGGSGSSNPQNIYNRVRNNLEDRNVFSIPSITAASFEVTVDPGIGRDLEVQLDDAYSTTEKALLRAFERQLEDLALDETEQNTYLDDLRAAVRDYAGEPDLLEQLDPIARDAFGAGTAEIDDLEQRKERIAEKLQKARGERDAYTAADDLLDRCLHKQMDYKDLQSEFTEDLQRQTFTPQTVEDEDDAYIKKIQPENIVRAINKNSLASSDLFSPQSDTDERARVTSHFRRLVNDRLSNPDYNGIEHPILTVSGENSAQFTDAYVNFAVTSGALDTKAKDPTQLRLDDLDFGSNLKDVFNLKAAQTPDVYENWGINNGHRWDVAAVMFAKGLSFLDNIRNVGAGGGQGYKRAFEDMRATGDDEKIRHSYGLENGSYVYRDTILNLSSESDRRIVVDDDADHIRDELVSRMGRVEPVGERLGPKQNVLED